MNPLKRDSLMKLIVCVVAIIGIFIAFVKPRMTKRQKEKLRKLIGFKFESHYKYRLPRKRLKYLEEIIQKRVLELLE